LLWFPSTSAADPAGVDGVTAASSEVAAGSQQDDSPTAREESQKCSKKDPGFEFLRRLLHSSGIHVPRATKKSGRRRSQPGNEETDVDTNVVVGKKRKRDVVDNGTPRKSAAKVDDVLSTVLKGYYRVTLPRNVDSSENDSLQDKADKPADHQKSNATASVELATSQLQQDLNSIILSRLRTKELFQSAFEYMTNHNQSNIEQAPKGLQMNLLIDEYMTHPTTSILIAYTSTMYDRYTSLDEKDRLLRKLLGLSKANEKIMQVVLLFLLEPLRRLYVQNMEGISSRDVPTSNFAMFPLLTSTVTWSDISLEDVEKECCQEPMLEIVEFILQSASTEHSIIGSSEVSWWSLPSLLWCFISQLYFPLACAYIRHWIIAAVVAHDKLYSLDFIGHQKHKPQSSPLDNSIDKFESAMLRMRHFSQTSQRLEGLTSYMLAAIKEEYDASREKDMTRINDANVSSENNDDAAVQQQLVWNAIKRGLES
jgi:hypothetical protein